MFGMTYDQLLRVKIIPEFYKNIISLRLVKLEGQALNRELSNNKFKIQGLTLYFKTQGLPLYFLI
jgi:hypothetical protein